MAPKLRLSLGLVGVIALLAGFARPADAGLLGTGAARYCDPDSSQVFRPWNDGAYYMLSPGGSFEDRTPDWTLSGGARVIPGNESYYIGSERDRSSLALPEGSSAASPTMCFAVGDWHLRFVGRGDGRVRVTVKVNSLLGVVSVLDGGTVSLNGSWRPSTKVSLLLSNVGGLLTTRAISLRFTAVDGAAQIDDVYVDPWVST